MTIQNNLNSYLSAYFQTAFSYLQSGDCEQRIGMAVANVLHWLVKFIVFPVGALLLYIVIFSFTFITNTRYPAPVDIARPISVQEPTSEEEEQVRTEVNTEEKEEEKKEIRVKRITSYEIEYGPRAKEVHVDTNREADFGEGYFTNLEEADEEAPF